MKALSFFIKQLKTHQKKLVLGLLLSFILVFSSVALLSLSGWFITSAAFAGLSLVAATNFNYFLPASMIRALALTRILSRYADRVINHDITFRILASLRVWFYEKLIPLSPAALLLHRSGDLLNRIIHDIDTLDHLYLNVLSPFLITGLLTISVPFFIAYFSIKLACITLLMLLIGSVSITIIALNKTQHIGHTLQQATADLRTTIIDALQGFIDLLLFVKKTERISLLEKNNTTLISAQKKFSQLKGFIIAAMSFFSGLTVLLLLINGITLVHSNELTGAQLAMIILLVMAAFEQLTMLPMACLSLGKTQAAAQRLLSIAQEKPAVIFSKSSQKIDDYTLTLQNISFSYPGVTEPAINHVNLTVPMNAHLSITGYSGAGKTTLLQLIARAWDPTAGNILLGNHDLKSLSEHDLRKTISLVTQHVHIFNASVKDNLTLMNDVISDDRCFDLLEKMDLLETIRTLPEGIHTQMGEFGKQFSGGQIRRIAIARALLQDTPILLLDEPSTGLDDALMNRIWKNCDDLFSQKTTIIATHNEWLNRNSSFCLEIGQK